ncbi:MAG: DUF2589 domain-containing protein [Bacteroidales bacterium]
MKNEKEERISSQVMELKDLIAGPLLATIDADSMSAQRYLEYLLKISFDSYDLISGKMGPLRMLTFLYQSCDLTGIHTQSICIPLLSLIPLPLLQIQEADFDFNIQVLDASTKEKHTFSFEKGHSINNTGKDFSKDTRLRVAIVPTSSGKENKSENRQSSLSTNMKVHVKMMQADMPGGLSVLLNKAVNNMATEVAYTLPKTDADAADAAESNIETNK